MSNSERLEDLINQLTSDKPENIEHAIQQLKKLPVKVQGITSNQLRSLISTVTDPYSSLNAAAKTYIISNLLYFHGEVPTDCIYEIIGSIGVKSGTNSDRRISHLLQNKILRWLISVYPMLENPQVVGNLYGILFHLLDYEYVRSNIAHLLFLSTKKIHINETRILELNKMYQKYPTSEHIIALLLLYQQFFPDKILDSFPIIPSNIFEHPEPDYLEELKQFHRPKRTLSSSLLQRDNERLRENFSHRLKKRKTAGNNFYYGYLSNLEYIGDNSLEEIANNVSNNGLSKQSHFLISRQSSFASLSIALNANELDYNMIDAWIGTILSDPSVEEKDRLTALDRLQSLISYTSKVPSQIVYNLLLNEEILNKKNNKFAEHIWFFIENLDIDYASEIIQIIELYGSRFTSTNIDQYVRFIESLSSLISKLLLAENTLSGQSNIEKILNSIFKFIQKNLKSTEYNRNILITSLNLISTFQLIPKENFTVPMVVLPSTLFYIFLFLNDSIAISDVGSHLNFAKGILREAEQSDDNLKLTDLHNSYVVDYCNIIWRSKAFDIPRKLNYTEFGLSYKFFNELANNVPIYDRNSNFKSLFNIHHSTAFSSYSALAIRKFEDKNDQCTLRHEGPLSKLSVRSLLDGDPNKWLSKNYEDIRVDILKELEKLGYVGLSEVLFSHLKSLLDKR